MITFHASLLSTLTLLVSTILPMLVGLVTTQMTSSRFQALLLALLAAITAGVSQWVQLINHGGQYNIWQAIQTFIISFVVGVATHYGFWKSTGASLWAQTHGVASKRYIPQDAPSKHEA